VKSAYLYSALLPSETKSLLSFPDPLLPSLLFRFRIPIVVGLKEKKIRNKNKETAASRTTHTHTHTEEINNKSMERGRME